MQPVEWQLIDNDFTSVLGIIPVSDGNLYIEINEPGSGSLKIPLNAPIASQITEGQIVRCHYGGEARGGFFVDNIRREKANNREGGGQWLSISGRGILSILDDAIIWDDGTGASTRAFSGTLASILITLINENKARGIITNLEVDFDAMEDSEGETWTDNEKLELTVGQSLLDFVRDISRRGIEFSIDIENNGDFTLHAFKNEIGENKSNSVYMRIGLNCEEVKEERIGTKIKNDLLAKYRDGFVRAVDNASISAYRRRAEILNIDAAQSALSASTYAAAVLQGKKDPKRSIILNVYDGVAPYVFDDYELGDYISLDSFGNITSDRIKGLQLSFDDSGIAHVVIMLNDVLTENEIRMSRDLDWLMRQWNTARDSGLLEVRFWAALGNPVRTYSITASKIVNNRYYCVLDTYDNALLVYDIEIGTWRVVPTVGNLWCLTSIGNVVYMGGLNGVSRYDISTDTFTDAQDFIRANNPGPEPPTVLAIAAIGDKIYFSGSNIVSITGSGLGDTENKVIEYDTISGTFASLGTPYAKFLVADGSVLYASNPIDGVRAWNGSSWTLLWDIENVLCLAPYNGGLLAGGTFDGRIAFWDGDTWETFGGGSTGASIRTIAVNFADVYVGGEFTDLGNNIARYSGGFWYDLAGGVNNRVDTIAINGLDVYVAGTFTTAGIDNKPVNKIAVYLNNFDSLADYLERAPGGFDLAAAIHNAIAKTAMTANDEFGMWDSISKRLRKIKWSNVLLSIKTYTDALYGSGGTPGGTDLSVQINSGGSFAGYDSFKRRANGTIDIGTPSPHISPPSFSINQGSDGGNSVHYLATFGDETRWPRTIGYHARGSIESSEATQEGDILYAITGRGYFDIDAPAAVGSEIRFVASQNMATGEVGAHIEFWIVPIGTDTRVKIATIHENGINLESGYQYLINGTPINANGAFQRNLTSDLILHDGESLVVAGYINTNGYDIIMPDGGDVEIAII